MKVLLIFPPDWLPSEPYLSLPSLTSVLRPAGHEVIQKDVNVEMYDLMFSESFLRRAQKRIAIELRHITNVSGKRALTEEEQQLGDQLRSCTEERISQLIRDAEQAKTVLRGEEFYDINKLEWAAQCLHQTMSVISLAYYPAQICFPPIETDLTYKPFMSAEILAALEDEQVNIYRDVYKLLLSPVMEKERPGVVGISIVQQKQLIPAFTFCKMIKESYPETHITLGGNIVTRIRDTLAEKPELFRLFDTAVLYYVANTFFKLISPLQKQ